MTHAAGLHVIFGTGPVGRSIMHVLHAKGYPVRMVNRSGTTAEPLLTHVELLSGDLAATQFAVKAAEGAAIIYNALNPPYSKWVEQFPALQSGAIAAAEAHQARLVVMDNLYMYGDPNGVPMHEGMPHKAHTKKGRLRAQMAAELMAAHQAGRVQVAVGRASDFIGPGVMASAMGGDLVLKAAVRGKAAQAVGDIATPHSYTYTPDIGRALVTLAESEHSWGQVWHLPTPPAISTRKLLEHIYTEADQPFKVQVAPKWLLRLLGLFNPDAGEFAEMVYEFEKPFIIDDRKFVDHFGWHATDLDTVVRATVAWFKTHAA